MFTRGFDWQVPCSYFGLANWIRPPLRMIIMIIAELSGRRRQSPIVLGGCRGGEWKSYQGHTWHRTCRHSLKTCLHIVNSVRFISRPSLLLYFAEFSNYINQKKNEINKKQEGARKLLVEFVREIEDRCKGKKRRILRKPEQRARARRLLDDWTVVVPNIRCYLGSPRMGKALK